MHHLLLPCRQTKRIRPKYFWIDLSFSTQIWVKITIFCSFWNDQSHKLVHMYILVPLFVFWFFNTQLLIFLIFLCNFTTNLNKPKNHSKNQWSLQEKILNPSCSKNLGSLCQQPNATKAKQNKQRHRDWITSLGILLIKWTTTNIEIWQGF